MSFNLMNPDGSVMRVFNQGEILHLELASNIYVETLCTYRIPHRVRILQEFGVTWITDLPGVFLDRTLMIRTGIVESGDIYTSVFNYGTERVRLEKGEAISALVALV